MNDRHDKSDTMALSAEQYRLVLDSLSEGVCTVSPDWKITGFNAQAEVLTGVARQEALGLTFDELFQCEVCECATLLAGVMSSGTPIRNVATMIINRQGQHIPVSLNASPLRDESGRQTGLVASFHDNRPIETLRRALRQSFTTDDIISKHPSMQRILDILPAVAESDSPVLILGPSGTGKELLAKAVHRASPRRDMPFVAVNCGALPDNLLESELFGYRKGAFTDARTDKPGRFAMAEGGTLFLDEIGDTSPAMQIKLLRVLQERVYEPLGATHSVACNVRIITATNRDLKAGLADGTFRADLYYRINVIAFELPPLSARRGDIPLLVAHFIDQFNAEQGRAIRGMSQAAMARLMAYDYPGNIRELCNIIERAYVLCRGDEIQEQCLPPSLLAPCRTDAPPASVPAPASSPPASGHSLRRLPPGEEREVIRAALDACGGRRHETAARLGIHPTTLWRKMKRYGLN